MNTCFIRWAAWLALALSLVSCGAEDGSTDLNTARPNDEAESIALVDHRGIGTLDDRIRKWQGEVRRAPGKARVDPLERLGSLYIAKARRAHDPGYYKLAESCADAMEGWAPGVSSALLLRGHVLHSMHAFADAERIARRLVASRGLFLDFGLLGDVLLDRGDLKGAGESYQRMMDLKPCLQSYSRAARLRWLAGDLAGARKLLRLATGAGSRRAPESLAWVWARLAEVEFQLGAVAKASIACDRALEVLPDYAPALLVRGRLLLDADQRLQAVEVLRRAAERNPLPAYQWQLIEALAASGRTREASVIEAAMRRTGGVEDPRTLSLYLSSRRENPARALKLAEAEMTKRQDIYTRDALAWALLVNGRPKDAAVAIDAALSHGTKDARLFFHAGAIAVANADPERARSWLKQAASMRRLLLPSEWREVQRLQARL